MARCKHCETDIDAEALVRHETDGLLRVHCPECQGLLGAYRDPSKRQTPDA